LLSFNDQSFGQIYNPRKAVTKLEKYKDKGACGYGK
jgi:hypothetical protein